MGFGTFRRIWELMSAPERRGGIALLGLMFFGMVLETLSVGLVVPVLALLTQPDYASRVPALGRLIARLGNPSRETLILGAMLSLTAAFIVKNVYLAFVTWRQMRFAFRVPAQLSRRLFAVYLRQPYAFHLRRNSAELLRNVTTEVSTFAYNAMMPALLLLSEAMVLVGLCTLLLFVEPLGALVTVSLLGFAAWAFHRVTRKRSEQWGFARQHHEGLRIQHLQQGFGGVKDILLLGRESEFLEQYDGHNMRSARMASIHSTVQQLPRMWLELLAIVGLTVLVGSMIAQGRPFGAVIPTLGLFAAAAFRLMPSANRAIASAQSLRYGLPVIDVLGTEMKLAGAAAPREDKTVARPFQDELTLDNVDFTYEGAPGPALKHLSITVRRGECVGFIGSSGAGKSTLVDVVLGLLTPQSGDVRVDGQSLRSAARNWQNQIGYVPQSIYLTDDTLRRNVAFGLANEHIDEAAVWRAIRAAQLEEYVRALPEGLDTLVGERGVRLSGGQRQRIGIARALYHDPAVLVLDEATSSLDVATERGVMQAVRALHDTKTIVIVAHRLTTVEHCSRLYRLERGEVVEEGTPATILAQRQSG